MPKFNDLTGRKFNRLTVVKVAGKNKSGSHRWLCRCDCGREVVVVCGSLNNKRTQSCGCLNRELSAKRSTKHGLLKHRLYRTWESMMQRCCNPNSAPYKYYGGRGITVCQRWRNPENFIKDMAPSYKEGLSLDRINTNKGYTPKNCRWSDKTIQARNRIKSKNKSSKYKGVCLHKGKYWTAQIKVNKEGIHLGTFKTEVKAALAYDNYIIDNLLDGFTLNFPERLEKMFDLEALKKEFPND